MNYRIVVAVCAAVLLGSCGKTAGGQHATVMLKDGTTVSGTVVSSSGSEIDIAGDDKLDHKITMAQVRTIQYDDPPPAPTVAGAPPPDGSGNPPAGGAA